MKKLKVRGSCGANIVKLSDIADKKTTKNILGLVTETFTNSAENGIISQTDFFDRTITNDKNISGYYIVDSDDFVYNPRISTFAPVGPINRNKLGRPGVMSPLYLVFHIHDVEPEYLEWYFKSDAWHQFMRDNGNSGARSDRFSISDTEFFNMPIPLPEPSVQKIIAKTLSSLETKVVAEKTRVDKLKALKSAMLIKMFPKEGEKKPEIRFEGFTDDWEQRKLSDVATMHARIGWQNLRTSEFLDSGDYLLVTGTDFEDGRINYATCHYVERERYEQDKHIQLENGSILITKDGTLGKVAYVQGLSMPATLNAGVFNVVIKDEKVVDEKYLFQYLKAPFLMDYVNKKATGGTIKHLNQNILVDFPVVMPCVDEQALIGTYFENLDHLITLHQRKYEKLIDLKKAMLEKIFGGDD